MKANEIKEKIQLEAADRWVNSNYKGTFELATGVGKTFAALQCILKIPKQSTVLILAEVTDREETIRTDIKKFDLIYGTKLLKDYKIEFACYQSAYKWKSKQFDLVIADEIHDSLTKQYYKFYLNNEYDMLVGLSATINKKGLIDEDDEENPELTKGDLLDSIAPIIYTINQDEAIELGLISDYEILIYYHQLDSSTKNIKAGTKAKPFMTTELATYDYYDKAFKKSLFLPEGKYKTFAIRNASSKRAKVLYDAPSKKPVVKSILKANKKFKFIIFGNSLDALHDITPNTVSSRNTDEENELIKQKFAKGKIQEIASFKKLKQGANLPAVNIAILHSYYSVDIDYVQRVGRILRVDKSGYNAVILFATLSTQEMKWLDTMTKNISKPIIPFHKLSDLEKYLKTK